MNIQQLNKLVLDYRNDRSDETFAQLYEMISANWRNLGTIGKSIRASEAETLAAYQDVLLECIEKFDGSTNFSYLLNKSIRFRRRDIYDKKKRLSEFEVYAKPTENEDGSTAATLELADDFNLEEQIIAKKKADQRQLIDSLLKGANADTTAIVKAFLEHPKPTATAIAKELGVHHSKVTRALNRLAGKFSTKQFGDYHDYLIAL
jgi:DNA-directed RNA polymerase specialized sigma24 family protein